MAASLDLSRLQIEGTGTLIDMGLEISRSKYVAESGMPPKYQQTYSAQITTGVKRKRRVFQKTITSITHSEQQPRVARTRFSLGWSTVLHAFL